MSRLTQSISAFIFVAVLAALPLLAIPFFGVSADLQKGDLAGLGLGIALIGAAIITLLSRKAFALPFSGMLFIGVPFALVAMVSALVNHSSLMSWWGEGLEFGTVGSILIYMFTIFAAGFLPAKPIRFLLHLFIAASCCVGIVASVAALVFGNSGTLGSWPEVSAALAAALICATLMFDWSERLEMGQWLLIFESSVLTVAFIIFLNSVFALTVLALLVLSILIQVPFIETAAAHVRGPVLSCLVALILFGALILGVRNPLVQVPPDIRPSLLATELVGGPVYIASLQGAMLGSGPRTFAKVWNKYRPTEFNATPLWSTSFGEGYSSAATIAVTLGGIGLLVWIGPVLLFGVWALRRLVVRGAALRMRMHADLFAGAVSVALFYLASSFFYTTGLTLFLLSAAMLGFAIRLLSPQDAVLPTRQVVMPVRMFLAVLLLGTGVLSAYLASVQFISASYSASGKAAFSSNDFNKAHDDFAFAGKLWGTPQLFSNASRVSFIILENTIASSTPDAPVPTSIINEPATYASLATKLDKDNFDAFLSRSSLFVSLAGNKVSGAEALASGTLASATVLAPNRPEVPYLRAVLATELGKLEEAQYYLGKTLALKPDYAPALQLQTQLQGKNQKEEVIPAQSEAEATSTLP